MTRATGEPCTSPEIAGARRAIGRRRGGFRVPEAVNEQQCGGCCLEADGSAAISAPRGSRQEGGRDAHAKAEARGKRTSDWLFTIRFQLWQKRSRLANYHFFFYL